MLRDLYTRSFPQHAACRRLRSRAITQNLIMIVVRAHRSECWVLPVADAVVSVLRVPFHGLLVVCCALISDSSVSCFPSASV